MSPAIRLGQWTESAISVWTKQLRSPVQVDGKVVGEVALWRWREEAFRTDVVRRSQDWWFVQFLRLGETFCSDVAVNLDVPGACCVGTAQAAVLPWLKTLLATEGKVNSGV